MTYEKLKDVKILRTSRSKPAVTNIFFNFLQQSQEDDEPQQWTAIYHTRIKRWIVTNDISAHGLQDEAANLQIIGFADNLDAIMFVVWEHQVSLGCTRTILDELREQQTKKVAATIDEWKWGEKYEIKIDYGQLFKPMKINPPFFGNGN